MTPPPSVSTTAGAIPQGPAPKDSVYNRDIMAVTKGFSFSWLFLVLLATGGLLQGVAVFAYQTYYGLGVAGYQAPIFWGVYITRDN